MKRQSNPPASSIDYFINDERSPAGTRSIVNYAERVPIPIVHEVMPHVIKTGIPIPKRVSPNQFGDQYIPITKRGSPNRFGDCSVMNQNRFGVRSNLGTDRTRPQIGTALKTGTPYRNGDPHTDSGTTRIDFQMGESQNRYGVHYNLGTNKYIEEFSLFA